MNGQDKMTTKQKKEYKAIQAKQLTSIAVQIHDTTDISNASMFQVAGYVKAGHIICEGKEEFVKWIEKEVGFKTAYAYRLLAVYNRFEGIPQMHNQSIAALHTMIKATDEQLLVLVELVEAGSYLTASDVKELIPELFKSKGPANTPSKITKDTEDSEPAELEPVSTESTQIDTKIADKYLAIIDGLQEKITELEELNQTLEDKVNKMPSLPQFNLGDRDCLTALGLPFDATMQQVEDSVVFLTGVWNPDSSLDNYRKVLNHRDSAIELITKREKQSGRSPVKLLKKKA